MGAGLVDHPERGGDQRCEGFNVRTHDQDVARLERRVGSQQAEDRFPEDFDLTRRAVRRVHLKAAIGDLDAFVRDAVVRKFVLQPSEERARPCLDRVVLIVGCRLPQQLLELPDVARHAREQRMRHDRLLIASSSGRVTDFVHSRPQRG